MEGLLSTEPTPSSFYSKTLWVIVLGKKSIKTEILLLEKYLYFLFVIEKCFSIKLDVNAKKHLQFIGFCLQYNWIFMYRLKDLIQMAVNESIRFGFF